MALVGIVDDDRAEAALAAGRVDRDKHSLVTGSTLEEADEVLSAGPDVLVLDSRMPSRGSERIDEETSVRYARKQSRERPASKTFVVSNYFGSHDDHDNIRMKVSPAASVQTVAKSELTDELMAEWIREQFDRASAVAAQGAYNAEEIGKAVVTGQVSALLSMPPETWSRMRVEDQDTVSEQIASGLRPYTDAIFFQTDAAWLVIGGGDGYVLRWGRSVINGGPTKEMLDEIRASEGVVPFVFVRSIEVDSISLDASEDGGLTWPGSGGHPHYPALVVKFSNAGRSTQNSHAFLFDTGADRNYVAQSTMLSMQLPLGEYVAFGGWGLNHVSYREAEYSIELSDGIGRKSGRTKIRAVRNWDETLGKNKQATGLLSTLALYDLKATVRLSGATRSLSLEDG